MMTACRSPPSHFNAANRWRVALLLLPSLLLASSPLAATQAPCKADQASALRDMNPAMGNNPCTMHTSEVNVTCDNDGNVVELSHQVLLGPFTVPDSFSTLSKLTSLLLGGDFPGDLPAALWETTSLQTLNFLDTLFTGSIPDGISTLTNLRELLVGINHLGGSLPAGMFALTNLQVLAVTLSEFNGSIPARISALTNLHELDLNDNKFSGSLPAEIFALTNLQYMDLGYNKLIGSIPHEISALSGLRSLSVGGNTLSGYIPPELGNLPFLKTLKTSGLPCPPSNSSCIVNQTTTSTFCKTCIQFCKTCSDVSHSVIPDSTPTPQNSSNSNVPIGLIIGISIAAVLILAAVATVVAWLRFKRKGTSKGHPLSPTSPFKDAPPLKHKPSPTAPPAPKPVPKMDPLQHSTCKVYSFSQLQQATGGWLESNVLGSGAFGTVYKGKDPLKPNVPVAIKRARVYTDKFKDEVRVVAGLRHPHVVRLLGYCDEIRHKEHKVEQILVFEFVPHGDLHDFLREETSQGLRVRLKILLGVASGLQYLHSLGIVHRDIKPHNVLLGKDWEAKLADFGLVRELEGTSIHTTAIVGTPGYVDPAYVKSRYATPSVDVYSFGVLMLQTITCHECMSDEEAHVHAWAEPLFQVGDALALKHPAVEAPNEAFLRLVGLALSCTAMPPSKRPSMLDILSVLRAVSRELFPEELTPFAKKVDEQLQFRAIDVPNSLEEDWESLGTAPKPPLQRRLRGNQARRPIR